MSAVNSLESTLPNDLLGMPLHHITKEFSAKGLEQRFVLEIEHLDLPAEDKEEIFAALDLALRVHDNDTRGDHPYSTHFLRVTTRIIKKFKVADKNTIIAALLHDTVEDHPKEIIENLTGDAIYSDTFLDKQEVLRPAALDLLAEKFDPEVADLVTAVTNPAFSGTKEDRQEQYRNHVREILTTSNPKARIIKLSDFIDNFSGQRHNDEDSERRNKRLLKYLPLVPDFIASIEMNDTPLSPEIKTQLVSKLRRDEHWAQECLLIAA